MAYQRWADHLGKVAVGQSPVCGQFRGKESVCIDLIHSFISATIAGMGNETKPRPSAIPSLIVWTGAGMAFGYFVLGSFFRGPGDPFGQFVGTGVGGLIGFFISTFRTQVPHDPGS